MDIYSSFISKLDSDTLKEWILAEKENIVVIDLRDSDFKYGKIPTSVNIPSKTFKESIPEIIDKYGIKNKIFIFHCMRSEVRGPSCSRKFLRYLLLNTECKQDFQKLPKIYVLDGGLKKWNRKYGGDELLLEPIGQN